MEVRLASAGAPDRTANEDYAFTLGGLVGVLDGVTQLSGADTGCVHSPASYVRHLAGRLAQAYGVEPGARLSRLLSTAIAAVRDDHGGSCDLNHPATPAATVCLLKTEGNQSEYLVLCDATLVLDYADHLITMTDDRFRELTSGIRDAVLVPGAVGSAEQTARVRQTTPQKYQYINRPGGYWIAAADPHAAYEAMTGSASTTGASRLRRAALFTDGASCTVDEYGLFDWSTALDLVTDQGPAAFIQRVRAAELSDSAGLATPRYKRHDDATVALCTFDKEQP